MPRDPYDQVIDQLLAQLWRAARILKVTINDVTAARARGDLLHISDDHLHRVRNDPWVLEARTALLADLLPADRERERAAQERSAVRKARDARRVAADALGIPTRAVTAAAQRGDIPEDPSRFDVLELEWDKPDWLRFAKTAVLAGEPHLAVTLTGIEDPEVWATLEMLAGFNSPPQSDPEPDCECCR